VVRIAFIWIGVSYVLALVLALDQLRRPLSSWETAGRSRRVWVVLSLAFGFHGLGQYAAAAYLVDVVPRFGDAEPSGLRQALRRTSASLMDRWQRVARHLPAPRADSALEATAVVAALLTLVSSVIHAVQITGHLEQYWLFGVLFAVAACLQALWAAFIWREPLHRRALLAGALLNGALIVVWAVSRTSGLPIGPDAWQPEAVGVADVISKLDELGAVILVAVVLRRLRGARRVQLSPLQVRLAAMLAAPLVLYSLLAAMGGGHHH
jgi:hypothetical protein